MQTLSFTRGGSLGGLVLAASLLLPVPGLADGFWSVAEEGDAPGLEGGRGAALESFGDDEADEDGIVAIPGSRKLGLAVATTREGRPGIDGLAYRASDSLIIAADGEVDLDDGTVMGAVRFKFRF